MNDIGMPGIGKPKIIHRCCDRRYCKKVTAYWSDHKKY